MKHDALNSVFASIKEPLYPAHARHRENSPPALPFVTISRQAGAGALRLARRLVERLNQVDPGERPWTAWDRELVERAAAEHHIPEDLVESLEGHGPYRNWLQELCSGLSARTDPRDMDEFQVYRRVARTIRALATAGRTVIVGRGGVYATSDLPGGVHVRLVAPFKSRVAHMAGEMNVPKEEAAAEVRKRDREREAFHRRYWPGNALLPEVFTVTINTAASSEEQMVNCILALIPAPAPAGATMYGRSQVSGIMR